MPKLTVWIDEESEDEADALHLQLCTGGRLRWIDWNEKVRSADVIETELESDE